MTRSPIRLTFAAALLALPAASHADEPGPGGTRPVRPMSGEQVYREVCQSCHMADAKGATGAGTIPALAGNPNLAAAGYPVTMIVNGRGAMPWLRDTLDAKQIAEVTNYVRTHFGNHYTDAVTEADVKQVLPPPPAEH